MTMRVPSLSICNIFGVSDHDSPPAKSHVTARLKRRQNANCRDAGQAGALTFPALLSKNFLQQDKIFIDSAALEAHNGFCCFDVRRYLSWIEGLTTNQYVGGSNPSRRTTLTAGAATNGRQHVRFFYCHLSERNVLEGSKIEASQYVIFRLPPKRWQSEDDCGALIRFAELVHSAISHYAVRFRHTHERMKT